MGIRILHVIDSMQPASGGAPAIIRQLIPYMKEMSLSSEVVCFDDHQSVQLGDTFRCIASERVAAPGIIIGGFVPGFSGSCLVLMYAFHMVFGSILDMHCLRKSEAFGSAFLP